MNVKRASEAEYTAQGWKRDLHNIQKLVSECWDEAVLIRQSEFHYFSNQLRHCHSFFISWKKEKAVCLQ